MPAKPRMQNLQNDLLSTASDLESLSEALDGHARYLRYSIHRHDASTLDGHAQDLRETASEMRDIAQGINP
jgi:hypothetical protein